MNEKIKEILALALSIAILPPLWAVIAPYLGIKSCAVALICAGLYAINGNRLEDALRLTLGFWLGDIWAVISLMVMGSVKGNQILVLFLTLAVLGALAVIAASVLERFVVLPAWLCGWAIGLSLMSLDTLHADKTMPLQIGIAMAVGVWYVGAGVNYLNEKLLKKK